MRATKITFDITACHGNLKILLDSRKFNIVGVPSLCMESYENPLQLSCLNEHYDRMKSYMEFIKATVIEEVPVFRFSDYSYQSPDGNIYRIGLGTGNEVDRVLDRYEKEYGLDMNPPFQRQLVWSVEKKVAFIEYLLSGAHSGREIYFNIRNYGKSKDVGDMVIVDGKQRLDAIMSFNRGEFAVCGGDAYFKDLRYYDESKLNMYININSISDPADVIRWYISLNTGGEAHTDADITVAREELDRIIKSR